MPWPRCRESNGALPAPLPLRAAKGSILNLSCVGSTRRAQNLSHVPGSHTTLPGYGRWSRPPTECVSTPSPREPSATLHNGRKMPMEGFEVFQVRDKEECKRSVLEAIKAGYPVFEHRDLANICETTVLCLLHTHVSRQAEKPCLHIQCRQGFWKGRYPFTGKSRLFQEQEDSFDSPSLIKAKLILPAQLLHQVHGECLATAWMFHEP